MPHTVSCWSYQGGIRSIPWQSVWDLSGHSDIRGGFSPSTSVPAYSIIALVHHGGIFTIDAI